MNAYQANTQVLELTDRISAAGQELEVANSARAEAIAKVAALAVEAQKVLPVERIAELGSVEPMAVRVMIASGVH